VAPTKVSANQKRKRVEAKKARAEVKVKGWQR
jgi:ribosome-associated protein